MTAPIPTPLHIFRIDVSFLARTCHSQVAALATMAACCREELHLSGEDLMALLDPIADQLLVLREMLDAGIETAENRLMRVDNPRPQSKEPG